MKVKPIGERLLVKQEQVEEKSSGGIILTQTVQEKPSQGEVRALGEKVTGVEIGDTVVFSKYAGAEALDVDGELLIFIDLKDVRAVIYG